MKPMAIPTITGAFLRGSLPVHAEPTEFILDNSQESTTFEVSHAGFSPLRGRFLEGAPPSCSTMPSSPREDGLELAQQP